MSTHLPTRTLRPLHRQCLFQRSYIRHFSITIALHKKYSPPPLQVSPSPQALQREALNDEANLPDDLGLITGTFVRVPWNKLPPVKGPKQWMQYEWKGIKEKIKNYYSLYQYKTLTGRKPYFKVQALPFASNEVVTPAKNMYKNVYSAFSRKDEKRINELCLSGVAREYHKRLERWPTNLKVEWRITGEPKAKMVSNRALELSFPGYPQTWIRQIVVRIKSRQRLQAKRTATTAVLQEQPRKAKRALAWTPDGVANQEADSSADKELGMSTSSEKEQDVTEYLVLQKRVLHGIEDRNWKIWGFTEETTLQSIAEDEKYETDMIASQS